MKQNYPTDHENRRRILESLNPRITVMGEATQIINPITGGEYHPKKENVYYPEIKGSELIQLQRTLARMDSRDGKIDDITYAVFSENVDDLLQAYKISPLTHLTIDSITDANGLDLALKAVEEAGLGEIERKLIECGNEIYNTHPPYIQRIKKIEETQKSGKIKGDMWKKTERISKEIFPELN